MKRFEAWVTAWQEKYEADVFLQAKVNIVLLLAALVVVCVGLFWFALAYSNDRVVEAIADNIKHIVSGSATETTLAPTIQSIQANSVWFIAAGLTAIAILFGFLCMRFMLRPTEDTLHYQKLFISNVAHELRTPLSVIKTSTEVALFEDSLPKPIRSVLDDILQELDRVSEIINNLLSLNSLSRPERMQFANVEMGPLTETVVKRLAPLAAEHNIEIILQKEAYDVVWGNTTGLEQIITNIIKNAIHYNQKDSGGTVTVSIRPDYRGSIVFSVADNGIGISQKDLAHIFEPFYRADTSRVRHVRKGGSGLGLTIVSEIVRAHHGKILIESARNRGTTVSVTLPVGKSKEAAAAAHASAHRSEMSIDFSHGREQNFKSLAADQDQQ